MGSQKVPTTSEEFFNNFFTPALNKIRDEGSSFFINRACVEIDLSLDAKKLKATLEKVKKNKSEVATKEVSLIQVNVADMMNRLFLQDIADEEKELKALNLEMTQYMQQVLDYKVSNIENCERALESLVNSFNANTSDVVQSIESLKQYGPVINKIFSLYNMTQEKSHLDYSNLTIEEARTMITVCKYIISTMSSKNPITEIFLSSLYWPISRKQEEDLTTRVSYKLAHFVLLLVLSFVFKPYFWGTVGLLYLVNIISNIFTVKDRYKALKFASEIIESFDIKNYLYSSEKYNNCTQAIEDAKNFDVDQYIEQASMEKEQRRLEIRDRFCIEERKEALQDLYNNNMKDIEDKTKRATAQVKKQREIALRSLTESENLLKQRIEELANEYKPLGRKTTFDIFLEPTIITGYMEAGGRIVQEMGCHIELKNKIFLYKTEEERAAQIEHIQFLIVNYLSNVRYNSLSCSIYDEKDLGRDFLDFVSSGELKSICQIHTSEYDKLMKVVATDLQTNLGRLKRDSVTEFNRKAAETKMVPIGYRLIVIASKTGTAPIEDEMFRSLMEYSASRGIIIWYLMEPPSEKSDEAIAALDKWVNQDKLYYSRRAYCLGIEGNDTAIYDMSKVEAPYRPYQYKIELGNSIINQLEEDLKTDPGEIRWWDKTYRDAMWPDPKKDYWTGTTQKGINIRLGFQDGDPSKMETFMLGDAPVHCMAAGSTGAGKSAVANQILGNLFHEYSPAELEIIMIDFKNAEFPMYTKQRNPNFDPTKPATKLGEKDNSNPEFIPVSVPHARLISGTKDGEYALSIFQYLNEEMARRTAVFGKYNVQNIASYNKLARAGKTSEGIMPRILLFIDEFTVMFVDVTPKILAKIEKEIISLANLARFCGCHMWFQTQEFSGTIPKKVMNQFSMRVCLRATADVGDAVLQSKLPAFLPRFGQCYSHESFGTDPSMLKRWVIPLLDDKLLNAYVPNLHKWAAGELNGQKYIDRDPPFYAEDRLHWGREIKEWHDKYPETLKSKNKSILLGESTKFVPDNVLPVNFQFVRDDGENLIVCSNDRTQLLHLTNTLILNIKEKEDKPVLIVNVQDRDNYKLLDIENKVEEDARDLCSPDVSAEEIADFLESVIESRQSRGINEKGKIIYFMVVNIDRMPGIGKDPDYKLINRFVRLVKECPSQNIHFIAICKSVKDFRDLIPPCSHRILAKYEDDKEAMNMMGDSVLLPENFAVYKFGDMQEKFKVYQTDILGEIEERTLKVSRA